MVTKRLYEKEKEWSRGQIKTCRKTQHVKIDNMKEMPNSICGNTAVGGNYNSTCDNRAVQKEINRIIEEVHNDIKIDIRDLIQQQLDIARADMNDYVDISKGFVEIRGDIDGTIVKEIKNTKDGISIKLYDKQKAIDFLKNNLPGEDKTEGEENTAVLAEILLKSLPNRRLEDFEQTEEGG